MFNLSNIAGNFVNHKIALAGFEKMVEQHCGHKFSEFEMHYLHREKKVLAIVVAPADIPLPPAYDETTRERAYTIGGMEDIFEMVAGILLGQIAPNEELVSLKVKCTNNLEKIEGKIEHCKDGEIITSKIDI